MYRAFKGEYVDNIEIKVATPSGTQRLFQAKGQPIYGKEGEQLGAVIVMHDITEIRLLQEQQDNVIRQLLEKNQELGATEERLAEANIELERRVEKRTTELRNSEEQLRLITDALPVLISYVDAEETFRFANKAYEDWFKRARLEVYGKKLWEVLGADAYEKVRPSVQRALKGEAVYLETKIDFPDEGRKYISVHYIPHWMKEKVVGYFALIMDTSEQKKVMGDLEEANRYISQLLLREQAAYAEAEAQRTRLYTLFMQAPSLLSIVSGKDYVYELANEHYLEALRIDKPVEGKPLLEVFPNPDPAVMQIFDKVFNTGERFIGNEIPVKEDWNKDGSPFVRYFNLIYEPVKEVDGRISGVITFGYEVTEHVEDREKIKRHADTIEEYNQKLNQRNEELERMNIDLDNFIYTASHDLKSPIVNLQGLSILIRKKLQNEPALKNLELLDMLDTSVLRLQNTISELTEIAKVQKGLEAEPEKVSFKEVVAEIKEELHETVRTSGVELFEDLEVASIMYPRSSLKSILYNLLSNAIKYRALNRQAWVRVKTYQERNHVVLSVEDNGLGISGRQQPKLFAMFKRFHAHVEGSGIGLYIIKRIVENRGGKIEFVSQQGIGSIFKVIFRPEASKIHKRDGQF